MENENLLTINEASVVLHISPATLRGWVFWGKIDYIKLNGSVRFRRNDLLKMIESCTRRRSVSQPVKESSKTKNRREHD